jgi:hypothetical protein
MEAIVLLGVTEGYANGGSIITDAEGKILGRTSDKLHTTRDAKGRLISNNTSDAGLVFNDGDE